MSAFHKKRYGTTNINLHVLWTMAAVHVQTFNISLSLSFGNVFFIKRLAFVGHINTNDMHKHPNIKNHPIHG